MIEEIREQIEEDCSITSGELVIFVRRQFNLNVCLSTIDRAIGSFNYSMKRITHRALAGDTPQNEQARLDFANWYLDQQAAGKEIIWLDEVPFNLSMRVAYGRSEVGTRAEDRVHLRLNQRMLLSWQQCTQEGCFFSLSYLQMGIE
jgi:hypothetical protein